MCPPQESQLINALTAGASFCTPSPTLASAAKNRCSAGRGLGVQHQLSTHVFHSLHVYLVHINAEHAWLRQEEASCDQHVANLSTATRRHQRGMGMVGQPPFTSTRLTRGWHAARHGQRWTTWRDDMGQHKSRVAAAQNNRRVGSSRSRRRPRTTTSHHHRRWPPALAVAAASSALPPARRRRRRRPAPWHQPALCA